MSSGPVAPRVSRERILPAKVSKGAKCGPKECRKSTRFAGSADAGKATRISTTSTTNRRPKGNADLATTSAQSGPTGGRCLFRSPQRGWHPSFTTVDGGSVFCPPPGVRANTGLLQQSAARTPCRDCGCPHLRRPAGTKAGPPTAACRPSLQCRRLTHSVRWDTPLVLMSHGGLGLDHLHGPEWQRVVQAEKRR